MERRDALKYTAVFMGISMSASSVAALLAGCHVDASENWKPTFFNEAEIQFVSELGETMLPKTKTPGAKEAMVERFLDTVRPLRFTMEENQKFKERLIAFIEKTNTELGKEFIKVSHDKQLEWLTAVDKAAYEIVKANPDIPEEEKPFYLSLKEQILGGYFSSEVVAKEYFAYDPIPGRYDPCIPYEEIGKAWAL